MNANVRYRLSLQGLDYKTEVSFYKLELIWSSVFDIRWGLIRFVS